MGLVRVAFALKKTVSEILQTETMPRFQILLHYLPQVTFEDYRMQQMASFGLLPDTWNDVHRGISSNDPLLEGRNDQEQLRDFQSDMSGLRNRISQIKATKRLAF